jgi:hypothetical protein
MRMMTGGQDELRPIMQCAGYYHHDCEGLVQDITFSRAAQHALALDSRARDFDFDGSERR